MRDDISEDKTGEPSPRLGEVFFAFLKLGCTSFGGPIAHLAYFRDELILRRKWMDEAAYADLVALCQFLPGPASSQVAFILGLIRGRGLWGGLAASLAFTAPSALIMLILALWLDRLQGPLVEALLHGLKLVAVAVVAQAVWGMAKTLTPDQRRGAIALLAVAITTLLGGGLGQVLAIMAGACLGVLLCRGEGRREAAGFQIAISRRDAVAALILFAVLLILPALLVQLYEPQTLRLFMAFYRSGALVFGGGHVVLPLLQTEVVTPGWIADGTFLTGYGLAQAMPGPLFTFAAYLGAKMSPVPHGLLGAIIATIAIFAPGVLLVYGTAPFWASLRARPSAQAAMSGTNAAVVGLLGAALYNPVWVNAVTSPFDFLLGLAGFLLGVVWKFPPIAIVILLPVFSIMRAALMAP